MLHHADDVNVRVKWAEMLITPDAKYYVMVRKQFTTAQGNRIRT